MLIADCRRLDAATNRLHPARAARTRRGFNMREPYLDRYLALLKDAGDEPKRWALIQLLIAEGARDKLAAKSTPLETNPPLPQPLPFRSPATRESPPPRLEPLASSLNEPSPKEELQNAEHFDRGRAPLLFPESGSPLTRQQWARFHRFCRSLLAPMGLLTGLPSY
jgi:hypothetical protein